MRESAGWFRRRLKAGPMAEKQQRRVAIVTGSSRGIGAAIAQSLAEDACDLMLTGRDAEALKRTAAAVGKSGGKSTTLAADLTHPEAPQRLVDATRQAYGRIDIVVCNAGSTKRGDFLALADEDWQTGFGLKFFAHMRLARAVWADLKSARGSLLFISGIGGRTPGAEFSIGGAVNAALLSLTKALAEKGIADGVQVNCVNPGAVKTGRLTTRIRETARRLGVGEDEAARQFVAELGIARFGEPADIAGLVAFVTGARGRFLQGALIDMDGGQTRTI